MTGDERPLTVVRPVEVVLFDFEKLGETRRSSFRLADQHVRDRRSLDGTVPGKCGSWRLIDLK